MWKSVRSVLALLGLTVAMPAPAQVPVTFGTNWVAQAEHGGFYQALADGSYEACGLRVTIRPGGPQVNNRALLMAGRIDFYMGGNLILPFRAAEQGIPSKVVAAIFQKEPQVLISHPGVVKRFEDLKDLDKLLIGEGGFHSYYQWLMTDYGFSAENRRPYTFNSAPFLTDTRAAQQGYVTSEPFAIRREAGFTPDIWLLADYGFSSYATTIETMQDTIDTRPDVVSCFVDASILGWYNFLYHDNAAAIALIKADNPDMNDELITYSIEAMKAFGIVDSGDSATLGIGAITDQRVRDFYAKMVRAGVVADGLDLDAVYTTAFVNKGLGLDLGPGN